MKTVYIESSVISYYTSRRSRDIIVAAHQEITLEWWEKALPSFDAFVSQIVYEEISRGDPKSAQKRLEAIKEFQVLEMSPELAELAERYYLVLDIPEKARNDAFHLALAVYNGMDYLVTWNCTHIAAGRVISIVQTINDEFGYQTPIICTPEELMEA
ncbi:MAG: type II toxin-antitoxin system VapC family toxin [Sedimentisphaerales bacterium]|nr:type II toxin-antitoxin system VapC family toxin [Sedimentisphaerales bacterium]